MLKVELKDKVYELPSKWEEVTINQFILIYNNLKEEDNMENKLELMISILSDLTGVDYGELMEVNYKDIISVFEKIAFINDVNKLPQDELKEFEWRGDKYTMKDFNTLSYGEFITLDVDISNDMLWNMPNIMAALYQKNDEEWNGISHTVMTKEFEDLPIHYVYGAMLFFCNIGKRRLKIMKSFLEIQKKEKLMKRVVSMKMSRKMNWIMKLVTTIGLTFGLTRFYFWRGKMLRKLKKYLTQVT